MPDMFSLFVRHPLLAVVPTLLFFGTAVCTVRRAPAIAAGAWALYALYELGLSTGALCSGDCGIRADLVLLYPVLIGVSIAALVSERAKR